MVGLSCPFKQFENSRLVASFEKLVPILPCSCQMRQIWPINQWYHKFTDQWDFKFHLDESVEVGGLVIEELSFLDDSS